MVKRCPVCGAELSSDTSLEDLCPKCLLKLGFAKDELVGKTISRYKILGKLGGGGMGVVYKAEDTHLGRNVALKFLPEKFSQNYQALQRFQREARAASSLDHPKICTVYDIGEHEGQPFIVMQFLDGQTLKYRIQGRALEMKVLIEWGTQIADALDAAHCKGIVHRDINPSNIFVTTNGNAILLDFGLAKLMDLRVEVDSTFSTAERYDELLTSPGVVIGTVAYMSPEQARGEQLDVCTDIFSLGVVLYEMATGCLPFTGATTAVVFNEILNRTPESPSRLNPELSDELENIINKALEKNTRLRYQSAKDLLADLNRAKNSSDYRETVIAKEGIGRTEHQPSIAVLPFVNMSPDPENEYFTDGLAEELINALSHLPGLHVAARTSAFNFKESKTSIPQIGKELRVDTVLEGSVRKSGSFLRITAQLINVADGYHLWSGRYDRKMEDVFAIQDEITDAIVSTLKVQLFGQKRQLRRYTENVKAYNLYLKGRHFWSRRTPEDIRKALENFEQATKEDPNYALAFTGMAESYAILGFYSYIPREEAKSRAKAAQAKALELDDQLAETHFAQAIVKLHYETEWPGAETDFKQAIELKPDHSVQHGYFGLLLAMLGQTERAVEQTKKAQALDPLSPLINTVAGGTFYMLGQYSDAVRQCEKGLEIDPNSPLALWCRSLSYARQSKYETARETMERAVELSGRAPYFVGLLGHIYGKSGMTARVESLLAELTTRSENEYVASFCFLAIYTGLGDKERILEWLQKTQEEGFAPLLLWITIKPDLDPLRSDPQFQDLLSRMNLEP